MAFTKEQLDAYIQALYDDDGNLSSDDYQLIINYILSNGEPETDPRDLFQVRRGDFADIPNLAQGEPAFTLDTEGFYIGGLSGNVLVSGKIPFVTPQDYGAVGDGSTDDTEAFKDAMDSGKSVIVPYTAGGYLITSVIECKESLIGLGSPTIKMTTTINNQSGDFDEASAFQMLRVINNDKHIEISGMILDGSWDGASVLTEHSHIICVTASNNVRIVNNELKNAYGDNIYFGNHMFDSGYIKARNVCNDCSVIANKMSNPYRCNVAGVSVENLKIVQNDLIKTEVYVASIDLEPNYGDDSDVINVTIEDNDIDYISGTAIKIYSSIDTGVKGCRVVNNKINSDIMCVAQGSGVALNEDFEIKENVFSGGKMLSISSMLGLIKATNNIDRGDTASSINDVNYPIYSNNIIEAVRSGGVLLNNCQYARVTDNEFIGVYSATEGCVRIVGNVDLYGFKVDNNKMQSARTGIATGTTDSATITLNDSTFDNNIIDVDYRAFTASSLITFNNVTFRNSVFPNERTMGLNNNNINFAGMRTDITETPWYVGELALSGGVLYMASGIASSADWDQIAN